MARGGHGGGRGGGGVSSLAPETGQFTAFGALGATLGMFWLIVKHPKVARNCVFAAVVFVGVLGADATPISHPFFGVVAIITGFCLAGKPNQKGK